MSDTPRNKLGGEMTYVAIDHALVKKLKSAIVDVLNEAEATHPIGLCALSVAHIELLCGCLPLALWEDGMDDIRRAFDACSGDFRLEAEQRERAKAN